MQGGAAPDLGSHETAHPQLQPDTEEQEGDSEIGDAAQGFTALFSERLQHKTRDEESDEGRESELPGNKTEEKSNRDEENVHGKKRRSLAGDSEGGPSSDECAISFTDSGKCE